MRLPATARWIGLALLGLVIAAAVAIAASNLVSRQIGIASESISAGDSLAPRVGAAGEGGTSDKGGGKKSAGDQTGGGGGGGQQTTPTQPPTTTVPTQPSESGDDHGGGSGHDGSDD